tara:strand:- start:347 stop:490 length:144 start_codon:yes stop_codon:yes gene_type:complete
MQLSHCKKLLDVAMVGLKASAEMGDVIAKECLKELEKVGEQGTSENS